MTLNDMMTVIIGDLVKQFGTEHIISRSEIISLMHERFGTNPDSVIPSDYCYNRINNGITLEKPALLEFLGKGQYRCLGIGFPYNGPLYHKPRKAKTDVVVGRCVNGNRCLDREDLFHS